MTEYFHGAEFAGVIVVSVLIDSCNTRILSINVNRDNLSRIHSISKELVGSGKTLHRFFYFSAVHFVRI